MIWWMICMAGVLQTKNHHVVSLVVTHEIIKAIINAKIIPVKNQQYDTVSHIVKITIQSNAAKIIRDIRLENKPSIK